jgi:hypothetical protein
MKLLTCTGLRPQTGFRTETILVIESLQSAVHTRRNDMLTIGEFAWLSQVTVETLRHYDRVGLLKPVHLDPFTGYRHYALDQLPRLNHILALKDLEHFPYGCTQ